jgi:hypothetical protein
MGPLRKKIRLLPNIPEEILLELKNETELEELFADDLVHLKDFSWLKHLTAPVYISLCNNPFLLHLECLNSKPNLKTLFLNNTGICNLLGMQGCTVLEELSLQHCTKLTDLSGIDCLKTLKKINLSYCPGIKNLDKLLTLPNLQEINLRGCHQITDHDELFRIFPDYRERIRFN